jgi:hypothetical protein
MRCLIFASLVLVGCGSSPSKNSGLPDLLAPSDDLSAPEDLRVPSEMSVPDLREATADQSLAEDAMQSQSTDMGMPVDFSQDVDFSQEVDFASPAPGTYIDANNGNDTTGNGTPLKPFQHLYKASTVAVSGDTIWAAPGTYPFDTNFVSLADGVGLQALTAGTVKVTTQVTFAGSGFARGILFDQAPVIVSTGVVNLDAVQLNRSVSGSGAAGIKISGTGKVVLTPGGVTNYFGDAATVNFAMLQGSSRLEVHGGAFRDSGSSGFSRDWLFSVVDSSSLLLDGVTIERCHVNGMQVYDWAQVTLQNGTVMHNCAQDSSSSDYTAILVGSSGASPTPSPSVVLDNSTITWASPSPAPTQPTIGIDVTQNVAYAPSITLRNGSVIEFNKLHGISMTSSYGSLTIENSRISSNGGDGVVYNASTTAALSVSGSTITANAGSGIRLVGSAVFMAKVRNTQITNNTNAGFWDSDLPVTSTIDLGKSGDNGGNTLTGNAVGSNQYGNVVLVAHGDATYYAFGNTWNPNLQFTDGSGHFTGSPGTLSAPQGSLTYYGLTAPNVSMIEYTGGTTLNLVVGP